MVKLHKSLEKIIFEEEQLSVWTLVKMVEISKEFRTQEIMKCFFKKNISTSDFIEFMKFFPENQNKLTQEKFLDLRPTAQAIKDLCLRTGYKWTKELEEAFLNAAPTIKDIAELLTYLKNVNTEKLWEKFEQSNSTFKELEYIIMNCRTLPIEKVLDIFLKGSPTLKEMEKMAYLCWNKNIEKLLEKYFSFTT